MTKEELIDKIVDAMSISQAVSDEGEMPMLYDIIGRLGKTDCIIRAAAEAALFVIEDSLLIEIGCDENGIVQVSASEG